jgi:hypothetical protein
MMLDQVELQRSWNHLSIVEGTDQTRLSPLTPETAYSLNFIKGLSSESGVTPSRDYEDDSRLKHSLLLSGDNHGLSAFQASIGDPVAAFFDRYVMYPNSSGSAGGFLDHLPALVDEAYANGRYALFWAVQTVALADSARDRPSDASLNGQIGDCYSKALRLLRKSLGENNKEPDDYDLMTVVVLDLFEVSHVPPRP